MISGSTVLSLTPRASRTSPRTWFHPLIQLFQKRRLILGDTGFHTHDEEPPTLKLCPRDTWNERRLIETMLSMLTLISHTQQMRHRVTDSLQSRLAFSVTAFNLLVQWDGLHPDVDGFIPLTLAEFNR